MDESYYWSALEFRICREFAGMRERFLQNLWCDGLIPERFLLDDPSPRITGTAWICNGPQQAEWAFTLFLPGPVSSRDEIDWAALLPPENVTHWLAFDPDAKCIQIEPAAAVPDPDYLTDELLASNPKFQALVAKSKASPRKPFKG